MKKKFLQLQIMLNEVIDLLNVTTKWKFNIPILKDNVGGIGGGNLMIAFARPETGKTAFWVSLMCRTKWFCRTRCKDTCVYK